MTAFETIVVAAALLFLGWQMAEVRNEQAKHNHRLDELNCVHRLYEDGSATHVDAETAAECLNRFLGWNTP